MRMLYPNFTCEPRYDNTGTVRIKITCPRCHAMYLGNADDVRRWQEEHHCAEAAESKCWVLGW